MSQKTKRNRRPTDESLASFKAPSVQHNKNKEDATHDGCDEDNSSKSPITTNGSHKNEESPLNGASSGMQTRSRSTTPLIKNKNEEEVDTSKSEQDNVPESKDSENSSIISINSEEIILEESVECASITISESDTEKNDLLHESTSTAISAGEELLTELQFDESDCETRAEITSEVVVADTLPPTVAQEEMVSIDLNDTSDSISTDTDNVSTRAVAGSDITRLGADVTYQEISFDEPTTYASPNNFSMMGPHRYLSPRRTIRPLPEDLRKSTLKNQSANSGRVISSKKRKATDDSDVTDTSKRFRTDLSSDGFFSYISSPISNLKSKWGRPSTPQLIGYEKKSENGEEDVVEIKVDEGISDDEIDKKKCTIM